MNRNSGILMHISSLHGSYSCGSFGKSAIEFIDFLKKSGFTYWQVLPFCITDKHNSPYMSYSSIGGNMNFVDLDILYEKGLLTKTELEQQKQHTPYVCEFDRLRTNRFELLKKASSRITDRSEIYSFIENNCNIGECCGFMALKLKNNNLPWCDWTDTVADKDTLFAWQFIQYEFHKQWEKIHQYANQNGIKIIGDLPFYVSYDSCDVKNNKEQFLLNENGKPCCVAGVPPDYFSEEGQLWGNPIYNWKVMKENGYSWWKNRLSYMLTLFDGIRLDHFRAFSDYWSIPADAKSAKFGKWVEGPGNDMIDVIKEIANDKLIIAENLGHIDSKVNLLLEYSGFPGMSVFQFGFDGNPQNPHLPHNYKNNLVAYTGTHDNNTLLGFIWELDNYTRKHLLDYVGFGESDWNKCNDTVIRTMYMSSADLLIMPIQDILGYGSDTRLNTPGRPEGNWGYRITKEQLDSIDTQRYKHLNNIYAR